MAAYAALLSLSHTLDRIFILDQYSLLLNKEKLVSLQENVTVLMKFLEDYSSDYRGVVNPLETRIIDAAYQAEHMVETQLLPPPKTPVLKRMMRCFQSPNNNNQEMVENEEFLKALQEINSISEEAINHQAESIPPPKFSHSASSSTIALTDRNITVGLDDDFTVVKDQMYQQSSTFHVIPIYGMGGIGKTTLATRLYEDSIKMQWFDRRIWIVVSQDYSLRKILLEILQSIKMSIDDKCTDGDLITMVHQELFGRMYLVVADDVWNEEAWDILNYVLPKDTIGNQVLVTTRLQSVATYVVSPSSSQQEIKFLSAEQSWRLLEDRVFGKESCPSQLEKVGMKIAECCRGLPLTIVVVAGLLKEDITEAYWGRTLNTISSSARSDMVEHCSKVLSLSYDCLPLYLKPCFLIVTAFPEDYKVKADRLFLLWMAKGFVKETAGSKCLEEVVEGYLNDLVGRSLLIASKNRYNGEIQFVKVHDSVKNMGMSKAREGRFYHPGDSYLSDFETNMLLRVLYSPHARVTFNLRRMVLLRYVMIYHYVHPGSL